MDGSTRDTRKRSGDKVGVLNRTSREMTEGVARTANRAMMRAVGFGDEDFLKPLIGLASGGSKLSPCNYHLDQLAELAKEPLRRSGGAPMKFNTFVVTDGMAMGHEGMKCSLVSREVIADVIELVARGHRMDALLCLGGCDKTVPGTAMPMAEAEPAQPLRVRRHDSAGALQR